MGKTGKTKKTAKSLVALAALGLFAAALLFVANLLGSFPFGGHGGETPAVRADDADDSGGQSEPDEPSETEEPGEDEEPLPSVVEIHEARIVRDGQEISLGELEELLRARAAPGDAWELRDAHMADRAVYLEVRELMTRLGVAFSER